MIDMTNLPETDEEVEAIINSMNSAEVLASLNQARVVLGGNPDAQVSLRQNRASILLARRLRSMRESSGKGSSKAKSSGAASSKKKPEALGDLRDLLGKGS